MILRKTVSIVARLHYENDASWQLFYIVFSCVEISIIFGSIKINKIRVL